MAASSTARNAAASHVTAVTASATVERPAIASTIRSVAAPIRNGVASASIARSIALTAMPR